MSSPSASRPPAFAAIDFGTSNSAVALPARGTDAAGAPAVRLLELEDGQPTMPTAVFYRTDVADPAGGPERLYGRAAIAAYVEGQDGRLMRSMKSLLGSDLLEQRTDLGAGHAVRYADVVAGYLQRLLRSAEAAAGAGIERAVLGRPVRFVDDDPVRDARAEAALEAAARAVGLREVRFQFEPIAAALDHERRAVREELLLVADIGGGTSDFSLVRIGPARRGRLERREDILANHGLHVAGTDFDRQISLAVQMPLLGFGSRVPARRGAPAGAPPREVPSRVYFDLATWHLINTCYGPARRAEIRAMRDWYADAALHRRLCTVLDERLGHALAGEAEAAKIRVAGGGAARLDLGAVEPGLAAALDEARAAEALEDDLSRIAAAAAETVRRAGLRPADVQALYFTGGSTGFAPLVARIAALFPQATVEAGDRFASVATGLGVHAALAFGAAGR